MRDDSKADPSDVEHFEGYRQQFCQDSDQHSLTNGNCLQTKMGSREGNMYVDLTLTFVG